MLELLLFCGADPADTGALAAAVDARNGDIISWLLQKFSERYTRGKAGYGLEVFRNAIYSADLHLIKQLLDHQLHFPTLAQVQGHEAHESIQEDTPLVDAIQRDDELGFAIFRLMLETILEREGREILDAIISRRRVVVDGNPPTSIYLQETAILIAVGAKQFRKVRLLIEKGTNINAPPSRGIRRTPLQRASEVGDFRMVEHLINDGANVNAPAAGCGGATALQSACIHGYAGIVDLLLRNGADMNAPRSAWEGRTALEGAAEHGRLDIVVILMNAGVRIDGNFRQQFDQAIRLAQLNGQATVADYLSSYRSCSGSRPSPDGGEDSTEDTSSVVDQFINWS